MNVKNLEFLQQTLKYLGFGDKLNADLEKAIKTQEKEFSLPMTGEFTTNTGKDRVDFKLDFRQSNQSDMYFLNRYQATLKNDDSEKERTQTFYINRNSGVTAKEAYNLLNGRAVNKDLMTKDEKPFNAWLQLDFTEKDKHENFKIKQFTEGYGFDLETTLKKYPIKELSSEEDRNKLMKSLEKGNVHSVTFRKDEREEKMFITANPQFKTLEVYDANMKRQYQGVGNKEPKQESERKNEKTETAGQSQDEEGDRKNQKKSKKGRGVHA